MALTKLNGMYVEYAFSYSMQVHSWPHLVALHIVCDEVDVPTPSPKGSQALNCCLTPVNTISTLTAGFLNS